MLEVAARLRPGWTEATEVVQLNGAISRSAEPTRYQEVVERFGTTSDAAIRLMAAPAIVGTAKLRRAGAAGDVLGRFLTLDGRIALPALDERTVGLPLEELKSKALTVGVAAGPGKGPIVLAALRAGCLRHLVTDEATAEWVLEHG
jgi:DNA-binding transcriptional regulator LsrR (DeoR family)